MKHILTILLFVFTLSSFAQVDNELSINKNDTIKKSLRDKPKENPKAPINMYRIVTLQKDTTYVDTSLTIHKDYKFNHLRKDNFGLLPFANDGQTYNTLDFGLNNPSTLPEFGFKAKHFNYAKSKDINYYSVATPITELYFKTTLEQGQSVDAFITLNTSEQLNFSIAYKGLRSLGKYVNSLSSSGNFRFTTSYFSKNKRYLANFHYTSQDALNGENGGVSNLSDFESGNPQFTQRSRLEVYFENAKALLKGKRYFLDHSFRINSKDSENNISINHQFSYESKMFEFSSAATIERFGSGYLPSNYYDVTKNNIAYNKIEASFSNKTLGDFHFFIENYQYNYLYNRLLISNNQVSVPNLNNAKLNAVGGKYLYSKNKLRGEALFSKSISKQTFSTLDVSVQYKWNEKNNFSAQYLNQSKVPDLNYTLYQSSFVSYNWYNNFKNEKINTIKLKANMQWLSAEAQLTRLDDYLYFSDDDKSDSIIVTTPKQYGKTINYLSVKIGKELKFRRFALDNTVLFQQVTQDENILNAPKLVTRNTLYFSDYVFKKAMFLQTGFTFQTFTKYYANDYNPLIGEFYVQEKTKVGDFPLVDFFINARVRQARIFLKAEHLNSSFTGRNYYSAPDYPYKDFIIRFGLVWTFFQ
ncbi:Putative porin [Flavobacterium swingsii]|uniref:Putative porin n=1 Tax=Flavobacterium swingsii TaxID=498292 RepID=A0A1I0VFR5_9FLAO|nr:putative porin [Flavobacterium swingsii]SFA75204.1 Putative porin [Flavobacterium swingsii]